MNLLYRLQTAIQTFRQPPPPQRKRAPYMFPVFRNGLVQWVMDDFAAYVTEGYNTNAIIYSAVNFKARTIAKARLRAYIGDPENPERLPPDHPLSMLCARPNPYQSWVEFQQQREAFLNIAGNSYTWLDRPKRNALPNAMYNMRPDWTYIIPETRGLKGYLYLPEGVAREQGLPILPQDMIHIKFPNPYDDLEGLGPGLSPMMPLAQSGDVDNAITGFLKQFIDRGAMMQGLIKLKNPADDDDVNRIKNRWREQYGGIDNWGEVGVLDMESEYQRLGLTFDEMAFDTLDARNESRMLGPFGVPPALIFTRYGLERNTFSNAVEARAACWEDTLMPELDLFAADDEYYLKAEDGGFVSYDTSNIPALQQNVTSLVDSSYKLFQMGMPVNQALATVGLKTEPVPGGDTGYLPISLVPVGTPPRQPVPPANSGSQSATNDQRDGGTQPGKAQHQHRHTVDQQPDENKARRDELWTKADRLATAHEETFRREAALQFGIDQRDVLALVTEAKQKSLERKAAIQWDMLIPDVRRTLLESGDRWREQFTPLISGVVKDAAAHWQVQAGLSFDVRNLEAEQWFNDYTLQFATPIQNTSADEIAAILQQGQREGWTVGEMQTALTDTFKQWISGNVDAAAFAAERLPPWRTEMIARTETIRAYNAGSTEIYRANNVTQREWLATNDDRVREAHLEANGQIVGMDELFNIGGEMLDYPGDPSGSPENTINCRCSTAPIIE